MGKKSFVIVLVLTGVTILIMLMHYGFAQVVSASGSSIVSETDVVKFEPQIILAEDYPPNRLYYNSTNELLYAFHWSVDSFYVLDKTSVITHGHYSYYPESDITHDPNSGFTYLTHCSEKQVYVFDGSSLRAILPVPDDLENIRCLREIAFNEVDGNIYVKLFGPTNSGSIGVIAGTTWLNTIQMPGIDWF